MSARAHALHFALDDARQVFGWLHLPPADAPPRRTGVILCPPVGEEYMMAHRALRNLATRIADAGFIALRIDYDGMGNSSGDDRDPDRVARWIASVRRAIDGLKEQTGVRDVSLFGLRFGGTLALAASEGRDDVASLVLYGALATGKQLVREIRAFSLIGEKPTGPIDGSEWAGFLFSSATIEALGAIDPKTTSARHALVVHRDDIAGDAKIAERLRKAGAEVDEVKPPGFKTMMAAPHQVIMPAEAWTAIVDWLSRTHEARGEHPPAPSRTRVKVGHDVHEEGLRFEDGLAAVLTTPEQGARRDVAVLFLNTGANHNVGPNRMYVRFSRALAAHGYSSMRFDISKIGEGGAGHDIPTFPDLYSEVAIEEARQALGHLRGLGYERVVLFGLCSGAFQAFHVALRSDEGVAGVVLVNVQILEWREGETLKDNRAQNFAEVQRYRQGMLDPARWKKVLRGEVNVKHVARTVALRLKVRGEVLVHKALMRFRGEDAILKNVRKLVIEQGKRLTLIYAADDPGVDYLRDHVGPLLPKLRDRKNFAIVTIDGVDHVFTPVWSQDRLGEILVEHMERHHP